MKNRQMGYAVDLKGRKISDLSIYEFYEVMDLVFQHGVICVRDQQLDLSDDLLPCIAKIGNVIKLPAQFAFNNVQPEVPQICRVGNVKPDGTIVQGVKNAENWHQDGDFWGYPKSFILSWLLAEEIPDQGGNTGFIDLVGGYEQLDPEIQKQFDEASFNVSVRDIQDFEYPNPADFGLPESVEHQAVYSHPILKKKHLYLGYYYNSVLCKDGKQISLRGIIDNIASNQELSYYHQYKKGDLLIWDNATTMHRAMGGFFDKPRLLYRGQSQVSQFHQDLFHKMKQQL